MFTLLMLTFGAAIGVAGSFVGYSRFTGIRGAFDAFTSRFGKF